MNNFVLLFFTFASLPIRPQARVAEIIADECSIKAPDNRTHTPTFYDGFGNLLQIYRQEDDEGCECEEDDELCEIQHAVPYGEKIIIECLGQSNSFANYPEITNKVEAICLRGTHFVVTNYGEMDILKMSCLEDTQKFENRLVSTHELIKLDGATCHAAWSGQSGLLYRVRRKSSERKLFDVCYHETSETTLFSAHDFSPNDNCNSVEITVKIISNGFKWCKGKTGLVHTNIGIKESYGSYNTNVNRVTTETGSLYIFQKGHLAPAGDFTCDNDKRATYYYLNAQAQYGDINNGNWAQLEVSVKNLHGNDNVHEILTGPHQILQRNNFPPGSSSYHGCSQSSSLPCPLTGRHLPVPGFYVKQIRTTNHIYRIFISNNIHGGAENPDPSCTAAVCTGSGHYDWLTATLRENLGNVNKGRTYCCPRSAP